MATKSFFWTTNAAGSGDQQASYSQADLAEMFRGLGEGVIANHPELDALACSDGGANTVDVDTGMAIVDGVGFISSAVENVNIPSASGGGNTRIDRIVVRVDWASFEATIYRIAGTDAASPIAPAITQTSETTYDLMLCQVLVDTSGNVTVTDERVWAAPKVDDSTIEVTDGALNVKALGIDTGQLAAGAVENAKLAADAVDGTKIADDAVNSEHIASGAVDTGQLAANSVTDAKLEKERVQIKVLPSTQLWSTGDGKFKFTVTDDRLDGSDLTAVVIACDTPSTSGTPTVQLARGRRATPSGAPSYNDMLTTRATIDQDEYTSLDAATALVINTSYDDIDKGDIIRVDIDVAGTDTKGLDVMLEFTL
jgi:hypothetical protein